MSSFPFFLTFFRGVGQPPTRQKCRVVGTTTAPSCGKSENFTTQPELEGPCHELRVGRFVSTSTICVSFIFIFWVQTKNISEKLGQNLQFPFWLPSGKHTKNYGKSPFLMGKSTISMAIFNSYVKLPEGIFDGKNHGFLWIFP